MQEAKHTRGPWKVVQRGIGMVAIDAPFTATMIERTKRGTDKDFIMPADANVGHVNIGHELYITKEESEANARLIAAAPELLHALHLLYPLAREYAKTHKNTEGANDWEPGYITGIYEAAVAKATAV